MSKPWRLTRQAEESLFGIAQWTLQTFGPRQAKAYEEDLIARCDALAAGVAYTQSCRDIIDPTLPGELRFSRAGGHLVIFVETDAEIIITDFLHAQRDLPRRLADLGLRDEH
jgi:toxin ParE1/3/4